MAETRTRRRFTAEFKAQTVKRVLEGGKGLTEVAAARWHVSMLHGGGLWCRKAG